jgi:hypothetical protein
MTKEYKRWAVFNCDCILGFTLEDDHDKAIMRFFERVKTYESWEEAKKHFIACHPITITRED